MPIFLSSSLPSFPSVKFDVTIPCLIFLPPSFCLNPELRADDYAAKAAAGRVWNCRFRIWNCVEFRYSDFEFPPLLRMGFPQEETKQTKEGCQSFYLLRCLRFLLLNSTRPSRVLS